MSFNGGEFGSRFRDAILTTNKREVRECLIFYQLNPTPGVDINELFCEAVRTGSVDIIDMFLLNSRRLDLAYKDASGKRPLHHAAETGNADIVKSIIDAGSIVNVLDGENGFSALHYAARSGKSEIVKVLVREGAHMNRNRTFKEGEAPLHMACCGGHVEVVRELIRAGANINILTTDSHCQTPLHKAIQFRQYEIMQALLEAGADVGIPDAAGRSSLHLVAEAGPLRALKLLIEFGIAEEMPRDKRGRKPIHAAVSYRQTEIVRLLVSEIPADVDAFDNDGMTPLLLAVLGGFSDIAMILIDAGAAVDRIELKLGATALNLAVSTGRLDITRLLLENGADPTIADFKGVTPLHRAQVLKSDVRGLIVKLLIMNGSRMNSTDDHGYTPLDRCVFQTVLSNFDKETLKLMTSAGAHLQPIFTESRRHRNSPLCWLVWRGDLESARFLVNSGWNLRQETWLNLPGRNDEHTEFIAWLRRLLYEPRTLIHMCRLAIRECLSFCANDKEILTGIGTLPLPTVIKKFLKFQEEMDMLK
ncbi:uncharacterized protein LOC141908863 [Tubulanus polymorphus]|uniref:uncharacterized protein LOC141908863 n=1 Tax=Tubulanus polymorphus TaxID=672921 RepID=UPI003DA2741E